MENATTDPAVAAAALARDGWAIVRGMIDAAAVAALRAEVLAALPPAGIPAGGAGFDHGFVERSPTLRALLAEPRFLALNAALLGDAAMTVHRSAAIVRLAGNGGSEWHTDMARWTAPPAHANAVLNCGEWPNGGWFYLNGCAPDRGGLVVLPGSHRPDWAPPPGFVLTADRGRILHADGREPATLAVPGALPLRAAPGDLLLFVARTYHAAFAHPGPEPRLSCGVVLRPRAHRIAAPWPLPERARRMLAELPPGLRPLFDGYTGIDPGWRAA